MSLLLNIILFGIKFLYSEIKNVVIFPLYLQKTCWQRNKKNKRKRNPLKYVVLCLFMQNILVDKCYSTLNIVHFVIYSIWLYISTWLPLSKFNRSKKFKNSLPPPSSSALTTPTPLFHCKAYWFYILFDLAKKYTK